MADSRDQYDESMASQFLKERQGPELLRLLAGCLQSGASNARLSDLFARLIEYATPLELEPRAYAVGFIGGMRADLSRTNYAMPEDIESRYDELVKSVLAIFDREASKAISIPVRRDAAEALAQGGDPRLRLPRRELDKRYLEYWVKVAGGRLKDAEVPAFLIGQHLVTVYEYGVYMELTDAETPADWSEQRLHPSRPVTMVSWHEAVAYCEWAGGRLPTADEWGLAARVHGSPLGCQPRRFAWGDDKPTPEHAQCEGPPAPVGLFPLGATPLAGNDCRRIFDLAGNVLKWTSSLYWEGNKLPIFTITGYLRADTHYRHGAGYRSGNLGFRCAAQASC